MNKTKRYFKKAVVLITALIMLFAVGACKPNKNQAEETLTNIDLVLNGKTDYQIVIPVKAEEEEKYAAQELATFFFEATACTLKIISDEGLTYTDSAKYLSIGKTTLLEGRGITVNESELNTDGFYLVTVGSSVFMVGGNENASQYAVYEFLQRALGYRFYAADESVHSTFTSLKLTKYNVKSVPDFAHRNVYFKSYKDNPDVRGRFRSHNNDAWGLFAHSYFMLLPPDQYLAANPDWYYGSGTPKQLCLTAPGLTEELIINLQRYILEKKDARYFMVGQEDTNVSCQCVNCVASNKLYGGASGTMMKFINDVARSIKTWQATACPERDIWIATFAYQKTIAPPSKYDVTTGVYSPVHPDVVAEDNVMVQYAPLTACYAHTLMDKCNSSCSTQISGWSSLCDNFAIWSYSTNFTNYLFHFNNLSSIKQDYQIYNDMGAHVMMDQGVGETANSPLHDLRAYIQSQLMWNVNSDVNALTDDFLKGFYKQAYPQMRQYYDMIRLHYAALDATTKDGFHSYVYNSINVDNETSRYWQKEFVNSVTDKLNEAFAANLAEPDPAIREKVRLRILIETLSMRYLLIELYGGTFSREEIIDMIAQFEADAAKVGLVCWKENTPVQDKYVTWKRMYL